MSREGRRRRTQAEEISDLKAANKQLRGYGFGNNITKVLLGITKWGVMLGMAYYASVTILGLAGKTTIADIRVNATASATADAKMRTESAQRFDAAVQRAAEEHCETQGKIALLALTMGLAAALGGLAYGRSQHRLRESTIARLAPFQEMYERALDAGRSSSRLTSTGRTRPGDE